MCIRDSSHTAPELCLAQTHKGYIVFYTTSDDWLLRQIGEMNMAVRGTSDVARSTAPSHAWFTSQACGCSPRVPRLYGRPGSVKAVIEAMHCDCQLPAASRSVCGHGSKTNQRLQRTQDQRSSRHVSRDGIRGREWEKSGSPESKRTCRTK